MLLALVHLLATWMMTGVIWYVQVVHYPLFASVGASGFPEYESAHSTRTTAVIALPWITEGATAVALLFARPPIMPIWMPIAGCAFLAGIIVTTLVAQVPAHRRLSVGYDARVHRRLVRTNWLRTAAWTARGGLAAAMLVATID